ASPPDARRRGRASRPPRRGAGYNGTFDEERNPRMRRHTFALTTAVASLGLLAALATAPMHAANTAKPNTSKPKPGKPEAPAPGVGNAAADQGAFFANVNVDVVNVDVF